MTLSSRQEAFARAYAKGASGAEACREAGYQGTVNVLSTQAGRLLKKAEVRELVDQLRATATKSAIADRNERLEILTAIARGEPHEVTHMGESGVKNFEQLPPVSARIKAAELMAKMQGDFVEPAPPPPTINNNTTVIHLPTSPRRAT